MKIVSRVLLIVILHGAPSHGIDWYAGLVGYQAASSGNLTNCCFSTSTDKPKFVSDGCTISLGALQNRQQGSMQTILSIESGTAMLMNSDLRKYTELYAQTQ